MLITIFYITSSNLHHLVKGYFFNCDNKSKDLQNQTQEEHKELQCHQNWISSTRLFVLFRSLIMSLQEKFQAALKVIRSLPPDGPYQPSNNTKLKFYSLYKQATEGPCNQPRPGFWDPIGKAKWDAWKKLGDMSDVEAMNVYIDELKKIVETMSFNGDVQDFLESIGPFYEFISLSSPDLDKIKEVVDRLTSSSGSSSGSTTDSSALSSSNNSPQSSPETTPQDTPAKEPNGKIPSIEAAPKSAHPISNGHIPNNNNNNNNNSNNKNNNIQKLTTSSNNLQVSSSASDGVIPPPSPMHKANGDVKRYSIDELEKEEEDETLEIQSEVVSTRSRHSSSGSSDKYYSGDSDLDQQKDEDNEDKTDMVLMKSVLPTLKSSNSAINNGAEKVSGQGVGTIAVRKHKTKHSSSSTSVSNLERKHEGSHKVYDTVTILQGTVDRLNRDIDHITARLRILEAAHIVNAGGSSSNSAISKNGNNNQSNTNSNQIPRQVRPFRELSASTWALIFTWPFAVHFLIKLISWYIDRRRRRQTGVRRPLALTF